MSKKAEEAALKAYPEDDVIYYVVDTPDKKIPVTLYGREKSGFILGYEQAEKDLVPIIKRLCEAIIMDWDSKEEFALKTTLEITMLHE